MSNNERLDDTLRELGQARLTPPPLPDALQAELSELRPTRPRSPRRRFVALGLVSLAYCASLLLTMELRPDLWELPRPWLVLYCAAWLVAFVALGWLAVVPGPGRIMPDWRRAGVAAALAGIGFVAAGFLFEQPPPPGSPASRGGLGLGCVALGVVTALVPVALGALLLRGRVPVGSRWAGAGMGAAGGSLGGLLLHLYCPLGHGLHLGLSHGGVVVVSAILGAVLIPRAASR